MLISSISNADKTALRNKKSLLPPPTKDRNGKYIQVAPIKDGDFTVERWVYDGPSGVGYIDRVLLRKGAKKQILREHVGPETYRGTEIIEELIDF